MIRLVAFDTEGTTVTDEKGIYGVLYSWDWLELNADPSDVTNDNVNDVTVRSTGRDVMSLNEFLAEKLSYAMDNELTYKIGVHYLSYDYFYMRKFISDVKESGIKVEITCKSSTELLVIKFIRDDNCYLEFFDTLSLFGYSLRVLGRNLGFDKLNIDYDENLAPDTVLDDNNQRYNDNDTSILMLGMCRSLLTMPCVDLDSIGESILTRTSIVRVSDRMSSTIGQVVIGKSPSRGNGRRKRRISSGMTIYDDDRNAVSRHKITDVNYLTRFLSYGDTITSDIKGCFAGGVNISNSDFVGVILHDVVSYDLKSAYPSIMLSYKIPVNPITISDESLSNYKKFLTSFTPDIRDVLNGEIPFWVGKVTMTNVRIRDEWASHVGDTSINKTMILQCFRESSGVKFSAGHFESAEKLVINLSMPLFYELCLQFEFDDAEFDDLIVFTDYEYPTAYSVLRVIEHYREKSTVKKIKKDFDNDNLDVDYVSNCLKRNYITQDEYDMIASGNLTDKWLDGFVMKHKGNLNSLYGIAVTNPLKDNFYFDDNVEIIKDENKELKYTRNSMLWRESGVCVTLFNRYKIVYMADLLVKNGAKVIYIDTDSIKFIGLSKERADDIFLGVHDAIEEQTKAVTSHVMDRMNEKINKMSGDVLTIPEDDNFKSLGKLDYEGTYEKFLTMGHKKYAYFEYDRDSGTSKWKYRCSGYSLSTLGDVSDSLTDDGLGDMVPLIVLGFDNRYDSSTNIATAKSFIDDLWVKTQFWAKDVSGGVKEHVYSGMTCPGFAIVDVGKIMNNTENSFSINQLYKKAIENNSLVEHCSRIDIARINDRVIIGKRGNVDMQFAKWGI